ncbi:hypothetical protein GOODEAATRI_017789 [Goodea atripinnis]|uniref:Uncharacterized protein n=1 Tax=Goodea atripinnis TaxID=208336 RepID=A0ABV0NL42_9TELE
MSALDRPLVLDHHPNKRPIFWQILFEHFKESIIPGTLTRFQGCLKEKRANSLTEPPLYFIVGLWCSPYFCPFFTWNRPGVFVAEKHTTLVPAEVPVVLGKLDPFTFTTEKDFPGMTPKLPVSVKGQPLAFVLPP